MQESRAPAATRSQPGRSHLDHSHHPDHHHDHHYNPHLDHYHDWLTVSTCLCSAKSFPAATSSLTFLSISAASACSCGWSDILILMIMFKLERHLLSLPLPLLAESGSSMETPLCLLQSQPRLLLKVGQPEQLLAFVPSPSLEPRRPAPP